MTASSEGASALSYPRTPNNDGEYAEPDGRIRISRERYDRLISATGSATAAQAHLKAALDREFSSPAPAASLSTAALNALDRLLVDAAAGSLVISGSGNPLAAARHYLRQRLDVAVVDD